MNFTADETASLRRSIAGGAWRVGRMALISAVLATCLACPPCARAELLTVTPEAGGRQISIQASPTKRWTLVLLEVLDPTSGRCVRTLFADKAYLFKKIVLTKASGLAPGKYRLRCREGVVLTLVGNVTPTADPKSQWVNPTDLAWTPQGLYVLDSGLIGFNDRLPPALAERTWKPTTGNPITGIFHGIAHDNLYVTAADGGTPALPMDSLTPGDQKLAKELLPQRQAFLAANSSYIYKFTKEGTPDTAFGVKGRLPSPANYATLRSLAVDPRDGLLYMPSGYHTVMGLGPAPPKHNEPDHIRDVAGYHGTGSSVRVNSVALGPPPRIYISRGSRAVRVYDRTMEGFAGFLYDCNLPPAGAGMARWLTADPDQGAFYVVTGSSPAQLAKYLDDGKRVTPGPISDAADHLYRPTGPTASGGLVVVACHGPGPGPFWDSGRWAEVVMYWDNVEDNALRLVERWGVPGTAANQLKFMNPSMDDRLEFMNPSAVALSADHQDLWVAEDGLINKDGPPGNARVRHFRLQASHSVETDLDLTKLGNP